MKIRLYKKILSWFLITSLALPSPSFAQIPIENKDTKYVMETLGKLVANANCENPSNDPHVRFYCQITKPQRTAQSNTESTPQPPLSPETIEDIEMGVLIGEIVGLAMVSMSYMLEKRSIGKTFPFLTGYEKAVASDASTFQRYLTASPELRKTMFKNCLKLDEIFKSFTKVEFVPGVETSVKFNWNYAGNRLSKTLRFKDFQNLLDDMAQMLPSSHREFLSTFHGERVIGNADELFNKRLKFLEEAAGHTYSEPKQRRGSLTKGNWGIWVLTACVVVEIGLTIYKHHYPQAPKIDTSPETLAYLIENKPQIFKLYYLDPYPEMVEFLSNYFKQSTQDIVDFENLKIQLELD